MIVLVRIPLLTVLESQILPIPIPLSSIHPRPNTPLAYHLQFILYFSLTSGMQQEYTSGGDWDLRIQIPIYSPASLFTRSTPAAADSANPLEEGCIEIDLQWCMHLNFHSPSRKHNTTLRNTFCVWRSYEENISFWHTNIRWIQNKPTSSFSEPFFSCPSSSLLLLSHSGNILIASSEFEYQL